MGSTSPFLPASPSSDVHHQRTSTRALAPDRATEVLAVASFRTFPQRPAVIMAAHNRPQPLETRERAGSLAPGRRCSAPERRRTGRFRRCRLHSALEHRVVPATALTDPVARCPRWSTGAATTLAGARTAAEVLRARGMATRAYDASRRAARLAWAKGAHDTLIQAAHRVQADALEIEAAAKRWLADEYDAAQERGEVATRGGEGSGREHSPAAPTAADLGLTRKEVHDARQVRDAEAADPCLVRRSLDDALGRARSRGRAVPGALGYA
jgi:hypothetical protein